MSAALSDLARVIQRESGIVLKPSQLPSLQAAITRIDRDLTPEALLDRALSPQTMKRLIDEITIRETFFFRHPSELEAIEWHSMLDAARAHGSSLVRVWVAGCASGEEAYTIAILACEAFACASPPVRVLGTDIAPAALEQAIAARYSARSVRPLPATVLERYFSTAGGVSCVSERLRTLVEFRQHNLVRDPIPPVGEPSFDVILCRNVLIYFDQPTVEHVLGRLEGALAPGGLLVLGAADRLSRQSVPVTPASASTPARRSTQSSAPRRLTQMPSPRQHRPSPDIPSPPGLGRTVSATHEAQPTPAEATRAADRGELDRAMQIAQEVLAQDPLSVQAHFIRGSVELARENAHAAVEPLRRALYIDPNFSLAAFKLARAHDALNQIEPARRAYERTLRTLDHSAAEQTAPADQLDLLDIATACHTRLKALR
jgi:chemotaxis protein methyltransferase CheR